VRFLISVVPLWDERVVGVGKAGGLHPLRLPIFCTPRPFIHQSTSLLLVDGLAREGARLVVHTTC